MSRVPYTLAKKPESKYYVYAIYFPFDPNPKYIGKGTNSRYKDYTYLLSVHNKDFRWALSDLFDSDMEYEVDFLYESDDEVAVLDAEEFYILYFGRRFNDTGILYNLSPGNYKINNTGKNRLRPVYYKGFIFESFGQARDIVGLSNKSMKNGLKNLTASYLDDPEHVKKVSAKEAKDAKKIKYNYFFSSHRNAFKTVIKQHKNKHEAQSRRSLKVPITIDGVFYESQSEAASVHGWKTSSSFMRFLKRGNHNHTYKVHGKRGKGKSKIKINDTVFESRNHAAEEMGYKHTQSLMYHLKRNTDKYRVIFPYIQE